MAIVGTVLFIALFVGWYHLSKVMRRTTNRHLWSRNRYRHSMSAIKSRLVIRTQLPPRHAIELVKSGIGAEAEPAFQRPTVTILAQRPDALLIRIGNKWTENYRCQVVATAGSGSSEVMFRVDKWLELDGVAARLTELDRLRADVVAAIRRVDPAAYVEERPAA